MGSSADVVQCSTMHTLPGVWGQAVPGDGVKDGLEGGEQRLEDHLGGCHKTQGETRWNPELRQCR